MTYNEMTKKQLIAEAQKQGVALPSKANVATIIGLLVGHVEEDEETPEAPEAPAAAATPTGTGLKIEKDRPEQNGIKRPSAGGRCRAVWDALDAYRTETGEVPTAKVVRDLAADEGWNPNNASIEFYQWRKYNGITGRTPKPAATEPAAS
jgi:hypothetical protein